MPHIILRAINNDNTFVKTYTACTEQMRKYGTETTRQFTVYVTQLKQYLATLNHVNIFSTRCNNTRGRYMPNSLQ